MNWRDYIVTDPEILVGKPVVKGTQLSVDLILDRLADGCGRRRICINLIRA